MSVKLEIFQAPMPKARPRFVHGGKAYHTDRYRLWLEAVRHEASLQYRSDPITLPVKVSVGLYGPSRPRGDIDNLVGGLLDALNGVVLSDDSQIRALDVWINAAPEWTMRVAIVVVPEPAWPTKQRKRRAKA